jgi:hypothetical protein
MRRTLFVRMLIVGLTGVGCRSGSSPDTPVGLELQPSEINANVGVSIPIAVMVVRADGTELPIPPRNATFRSTDESVARMATDSAGLVIVSGPGEAEIGVTVTFDGRRLVKTLRVRVGFVIPSK